MQFSKVNAMLDPLHAKMNTKHFVLKNYDTKGITVKPITEGGGLTCEDFPILKLTFFPDIEVKRKASNIYFLSF